MTETKSKFALALEARPRKTYATEVQGFFGLGEKPIHRIAFRINTKKEEDAAIVAAHETLDALTARAPEARKDGDLLNDSKSIEALYRACLVPDEDRKTEMGVERSFPGPEWMKDHLTTDEVAVLINLYNEVRYKNGPVRNTITMDQVLTAAVTCSEYSDSEIPEAVLAGADREWLTQAFTLLACKYTELLREFPSEDGVVGSEGRDEKVSDVGGGSGKPDE